MMSADEWEQHLKNIAHQNARETAASMSDEQLQVAHRALIEQEDEHMDWGWRSLSSTPSWAALNEEMRKRGLESLPSRYRPRARPGYGSRSQYDIDNENAAIENQRRRDMEDMLPRGY